MQALHAEDLSESRLRELPAKSFPAELRVLNLEFNELRELPEELFHGLSKLKVLWLTGNHYEMGEKGYKKMKARPLGDILNESSRVAREAAGNRLERLHPKQFQGLSSLQVLLLHHNRLEVLPEALFQGLSKLRSLTLSSISQLLCFALLALLEEC